MLTFPGHLFLRYPRRYLSRLLRPVRASVGGVIELDPRRIYILPTRAGLFYAVLLVSMLIGSINYGLSLGYALTFLLVGLGFIAMLHTWRNLAGLTLQADRAASVFAGENAQFSIVLGNPRRQARHAILLTAAGAAAVCGNIPGMMQSVLTFSFPTHQRGWLVLPRCTVASEFPLGLFRAWAYVELPARCLVYPRPAAPGTPWLAADTSLDAHAQGSAGDGDFSGLREYCAGDSLRRVDWKASARSEFLLSKEFAGSAGSLLWLDWQATPGRDDEARIAQLTRWALDAQAAGLSFGLRLPGREIPPSLGGAHLPTCLQALALYGLHPADQH